MNLEKIIKILVLIYFAHKLGIQKSGSHIFSLSSTVICIPSSITSSWYLNYKKYFFNALNIFFVGSSFHHSHNFIFKAKVINKNVFKNTLQNSENCSLYKNSDDIRHTVFIISHFIINKYTVSMTFTKKNESMLFMNNIDTSSESSSFLHFNKRTVQLTLKKQTRHNRNRELNDAVLAEDEQVLHRKTSRRATFLEVTRQ